MAGDLGVVGGDDDLIDEHLHQNRRVSVRRWDRVVDVSIARQGRRADPARSHVADFEDPARQLSGTLPDRPSAVRRSGSGRVPRLLQPRKTMTLQHCVERGERWLVGD